MLQYSRGHYSQYKTKSLEKQMRGAGAVSRYFVKPGKMLLKLK